MTNNTNNKLKRYDLCVSCGEEKEIGMETSSKTFFTYNNLCESCWLDEQEKRRIKETYDSQLRSYYSNIHKYNTYI